MSNIQRVGVWIVKFKKPCDALTIASNPEMAIEIARQMLLEEPRLAKYSKSDVSSVYRIGWAGFRKEDFNV